MVKASTRPTHKCTECGWTTGRWVGRCGECQTWGSVVEEGAPKLAQVKSSTPVSKAVPIREVSADLATRALTGVGELDRVLGDGLVPGAVVLLAGEPGVGKSTLLLEVAARWAKAGRTTLYVSGEESAAQVRLRAGRTNALAERLYLAAETDLGTVLGHIEEVEPSLMVLDSVQSIGTAEADGSPGGVTQVREVTAALVRVAKRRGMAVIIVGHVTKDGSIAGPRLLEHLVDVVLAFDGDRHSGFRMVRATKNRFGPADEVGCFEMADSGIVEVPDPSGLFTSEHAEPVPGTCITVTMEGRRPLLAELQSLVARQRCRNRGGPCTASTPVASRWCWRCSNAAAGSGSTTVMSTSRASEAPRSPIRPPTWPPRCRSPRRPSAAVCRSVWWRSAKSAWPVSCGGCPGSIAG